MIFFSENYRVTIWRSLVQASNGSLNRGINPTLSSVSITYNQNPKFIDESTLDLRLNTTSPAKNGGSAALFGLASIIQPAIDLTGISRILDGTIDMGAYECPTKLYVNDEATGDDGGADWANATHDLQKALKAAVPNTEIWVAAGTYKPTTGTDRTISFQLPDSVKIYGGFAGNEATNYNLDLRNFTTNETILSGDIGTLNNSTDNTYHVVFTKNVSPETVVDGLTITEGNAANDPFPNNSGGGWLNDGYGTGNSSNPTLANCTFASNTAGRSGGAMYNDGFNNGISNPTLANCTFASNTAGRSGGAMYNDGETGVSSPVLTNCTFTSNTAESDGGAMYNAGSDGISNPTLTNCTFTSNTAGRSGGAIYNDGRYGKSSPNFTQCSFTSNNATEDGGAIYWRGGVINSQLINCVFNANGTEHLYYYEVSNYKAKLINCTFYGATERVIRGFFDSGIGNESPVDFTNCIFWGNGNNIVDKDIDNTAFTANPNTMVNITHSIVEEVAFTQGIFSGNNNLNLPPRFLDATNGIFNINCASAARNTGTLTGAPAIDITGFARTGNPDMGAYEYGYALIQNDLAASLYIPIQGVPSITASSEILNDNNVLMQGIQSVLLAPGFEVAPELGDGSNPTVFKAEIGGGCN
jgi:predicted outer membrane repeat protein